MLKRFFEKHETLMCILLIALYIVINAFCVNSFGSDDYRSALINTAFSAVLILLAVSLKRVSYYGLTKPQNVKTSIYITPSLTRAETNKNKENTASAVFSL